MAGLGTFLDAIIALATVSSLFNVAWATTLGIAVGMMPGLTATLGIALLTTLTFRLDAGDAILILICMYVGAIYGGSRSAILLNIPGTPANAASALDGFPMARSGKAGEALGHRHHRLVCRQPGRHGAAGAHRARARRGRAQVPVLRVRLARRLRRRHLRPADGHRRSDQGLDRRVPGAAAGAGRPGGHPRLSALRLRAGDGGRARAAAGAGRRLRLRRGADGHAPGQSTRSSRMPAPGCCRGSARPCGAAG